MSNEIINIPQQDKAISIWNSPEHLQTVMDSFGKNLSKTEFDLFVQMGISTGLNPFLREIWAVKFGSNPAQIFIGRDGYRKVAARNPAYKSHVAMAVYSNDEYSFDIDTGKTHHKYNFKDRGTLIGAYCIVRVRTDNVPFHSWVSLAEYNKGQSNWKTMPETMIKKVAEAQALRMICPELAGTYAEEENWMDEKGRLLSGKSKASSLNEQFDLAPKEEISMADHDHEDTNEHVVIEQEINHNFLEIMERFESVQTKNELDAITLMVQEQKINLSSNERKILNDVYREASYRIKSLPQTQG